MGPEPVIFDRFKPPVPGHSQGYTLIEMVVVMFLIALGTGIFLGYNFQQQDSLRLRSAARETYSYLLNVRSLAQLMGKTNSCWYRPEKLRLENELSDAVLYLPEGIQIAEAADQKDEDSFALVRFYADGSADQAEITLKLQKHILQLQVEPLLGDVSIETPHKTVRES